MPARNLSSYDVAVIGAGVFGAWTAYCLRKAGATVLLVDSYGPAHSRASSGGESRIIRMGYGPDEMYTRWSLHALPRWQELFAEAGRSELFHRTGVLWIADEREREPYARETLATLSKLRVPHEKLSNADLRQRYPQIAVDDTSWGIFEPSSGVLMARRAVQTVVAQAQKIGVDYEIAAAAPPPPASALRDRLRIATDHPRRKYLRREIRFRVRPVAPQTLPRPRWQSHLRFSTGNFLLRRHARRHALPTARIAHVARPARRILRHARSRNSRLQSRQRSPRPRRRSRHAIARRYSRRHRRRKRISRAPVSRPERRPHRRNARLPVRKHLQWRFFD